MSWNGGEKGGRLHFTKGSGACLFTMGLGGWQAF